jgi:hypothetical protein
MKTSLLLLFLLLQGSIAQDQKPGADQSADKTKPGEPVASPRPQPSTEELEAKFIATLTRATMAGRWTSIKDGVLGSEKEDKYTIIGVTKTGGDNWVIKARIQYNKRDIIAPIPLKVKWAGDTPVIIVNNIPVPGGGVFSARVLIYEHTYAGTWTGGDHGGLLSGLITNEAEDKPAEPK